MVSRKKAAGKARRAARARKAEEDGNNNNQVNNDDLEEQSEQLRSDASRYLTAPAPLFQPTSCRHGASALSSGRVPLALGIRDCISENI